MRTTLLISGLLVGLASTASAAPDICSGEIAPIRSIDRTCLPAGAPRPDLPLYNTDLAEQYQEIATVDSFVSADNCADTTRNQLQDLQIKGQSIGADAMIRVRMLANEAYGWKENPDTPFFSVRQGGSKDYFFRATAVKYLRWPKGEPKPAAAPAVRQAVTTVSPLIDTNDLLKLNNNRTRRHEMTVPEVLTTNQPQGIP